jgi:hypothetical protein
MIKKGGYEMRTLLIFCFAALLFAAADEKPKKAGKPAVTTLTGCVDQRGDRYVLTGDKELNAVAELHGDGFPDDNFARYVGHKVTVEGALAREGEMPVIKVRKITDVANECSPE